MERPDKSRHRAGRVHGQNSKEKKKVCGDLERPKKSRFRGRKVKKRGRIGKKG